MAIYPEIESAVTLISGAGSGMGRACAIAFGKAGAKLVLVDVNDTALKGTAELLEEGTWVKTVVADICDDAAVYSLVNGIPSTPELGRLDFALNCAGVAGNVRGPIGKSDTKDDDFIMNLNVRAQAIMIKAQLGVMLAQSPRTLSDGSVASSRGTIVNWASWVGFHGSATSWAYSASKHAVVAQTKSVALGHAAEGIRCNAVAPGVMNTPFLATCSPEQVTRMLANTPAKRAGEAVEVANCVLFLCSESASYVNGAILHIDGGWHAA